MSSKNIVPINNPEDAEKLLTDDQISEFKQAFDLFKEENGLIKSGDLGILMRSLGQTVSDEEIKEMINEVDEKKTRKIAFPEFLMLISRKIQDIDEEEELRQAFKIFDRDNKNFISTAELKYVMKNLGEKLSETEVDDMIKEADPENTGKLDYHGFVKMLLGN